MSDFLEFFSSSPEVATVALGICLLSFGAYHAWYKPAIDTVASGLNRAVAALAQATDTWIEARHRVRVALQSYPHLASSWLETERRVFAHRVDDKPVAVMFGAPRDLWNPQDLLARRFNLALAEAVPNILVGVGLFFTFFFLSSALMSTTKTLADHTASALDTQNAISHLLQMAGGKFLTSLAGLLSSIVWTLFSKRALSNLSSACDNFIDALGKLVNPNGTEEVMCRQFGLIEDGVALQEELLNEAREQTGTFKRFETDLAITLAGAITTSFGPQM